MAVDVVVVREDLARVAVDALAVKVAVAVAARADEAATVAAADTAAGVVEAMEDTEAVVAVVVVVVALCLVVVALHSRRSDQAERDRTIEAWTEEDRRLFLVHATIVRDSHTASHTYHIVFHHRRKKKKQAKQKKENTRRKSDREKEIDIQLKYLRYPDGARRQRPIDQGSPIGAGAFASHQREDKDSYAQRSRTCSRLWPSIAASLPYELACTLHHISIPDARGLWCLVTTDASAIKKNRSLAGAMPTRCAYAEKMVLSIVVSILCLKNVSAFASPLTMTVRTNRPSSGSTASTYAWSCSFSL